MKKLIFHPIIATYLGFQTASMLAVSFCFVTYVPFLAERGMNLWQINVINSFYMGFVLLSEMPTGSFADTFGRGRSLSLSCLLLSVGALAYFFASSFWLFIIAEIIIAIAHTFSSGAAEAWLVDSLKVRGESSLQPWVFRQEQHFKSAGNIIGALAGAYLGGFDLGWPWLAVAGLMLLVGLFSLKIKEHHQVSQEKSSQTSLNCQLKSAWNHGIRSPDLLLIMSFGACLAFSVQALNMQWALLFKTEYGLTSPELGWVYVGIAVSMALGARFSKKVSHLLKEKSALIIPQLLTAGAIIACALAGKLFIIATAFFIHEFGRGIIGPLRKHFLNERIPSHNRATVLSLDSMFSKLGALGGLLITGLIAEQFSIRTAWIFSGLSLFLSVIIFFLIIKKEEKWQGPKFKVLSRKKVAESAYLS